MVGMEEGTVRATLLKKKGLAKLNKIQKELFKLESYIKKYWGEL